MANVVETLCIMTFESLQEGEMPVRFAREILTKHGANARSRDVVSITIGPYNTMSGTPEQMLAFANMLKQTCGNFRFGERLQHHAKLDFVTATHDRTSRLTFWTEGLDTPDVPSQQVEMMCTINEVLQIANCIEVTARMAVPARPRRPLHLEIDVSNNRMRFERQTDDTVIIVFNETERVRGSIEAADMLMHGLMKQRTALIDEMSVWFGGEEIRIARTEDKEQVCITTVSRNARFRFTMGGAELVTDALGTLLGYPI